MATALERFMDKVELTTDCWLWTGALLEQTGYGQFRDAASKVVKAHRWSYEHHVAPIPAGHQVHHRCGVRRCVRPDHLEAITTAEHGTRHRRGTRGKQVVVPLPPEVVAPFREEARRRHVSMRSVIIERLTGV